VDGRIERSALARRIATTSRIRGTFRLRSGRVSETYFDKYLFESDPVLLRAIAEQMAPLIPPDTDVLCGLEMGGIPVVTVLSQVTGLPAAFVRKARKAYGTEKYAEGPALAGHTIALVEDVVSTGGALLDAAAMLRADGIAVATAVCVIDRQTGGREALAAAGIELRALFTMTEIESQL
jgi:orotate phosphoribosyltransferase